MDLLQLRYLCTAARYENFSRAARHHNIPQSAISKTIAQLERELGVRLFVRRGNRVTLSEAGKKFCREVQTALDMLNAAAGDLRGGDDALHGEIKLLVEEHYHSVLRLISDFRIAHPHLTFKIFRCPEADFDYDLRLSAASSLGDRLGAIPLKDVEVRLLLPSVHRLSEWESVPLEALGGENLVLLAPTPTASVVTNAALERAGVKLSPVLTCEGYETLFDAVAAGIGIAFSSGITPESAGEGLAVRSLAGCPITYPTVLSWRRTPSPAALAFREAVARRLAPPPTNSAKNS